METNQSNRDAGWMDDGFYHSSKDKRLQTELEKEADPKNNATVFSERACNTLLRGF